MTRSSPNRVRLLVASLFICTAFAAQHLSAQTLKPGVLTRVTLADGKNSEHEGVLVRATADSVWLIPTERFQPGAFSIAATNKIEQSRGYRPRGKRAFTGGLIGLATWTVASSIAVATMKCNPPCERELGILVVFYGGPLVGIPIGAGIGAVTGGAHWQVIPQRVSERGNSVRNEPRMVRLASISF